MLQAAYLPLLRSHESTASWLEYLDGVGSPPFAVILLGGAAFLDTLRDLDIPGASTETLVAMRSTIVESPDLWWLLERSVHSLWLHLDTADSPPAFPKLPTKLGEIGRYFFAFVFVAMLPLTKGLYRKRGISDAVLLATMADVGRHFLIHRAQTGFDGMSGADWLMLHARGVIFQLGRLQFERGRLGNRTSQAIQDAGLTFQKGDPCLAVHIPGFAGSFSAEACDDSFAQARTFFARHFPAERYRIAVCKSWLLDGQLADYLPATSNIVRFQQRFRSAFRPEPNNHDTLEFVFRTPNRPLDALPQNSTLERAVVSHIRNGKQWYGGMGWLEL